MQNATALKLLGQIPFCQQCCKAVLRWNPRETSLLLLQSSQKAKFNYLTKISLGKITKELNLTTSLSRARQGGGGGQETLEFWQNSALRKGNLFPQYFPLT